MKNQELSLHHSTPSSEMEGIIKFVSASVCIIRNSDSTPLWMAACSSIAIHNRTQHDQRTSLTVTQCWLCSQCVWMSLNIRISETENMLRPHSTHNTSEWTIWLHSKLLQHLHLNRYSLDIIKCWCLWKTLIYLSMCIKKIRDILHLLDPRMLKHRFLSLSSKRTEFIFSLIVNSITRD